jgi:hypothetical protein
MFMPTGAQENRLRNLMQSPLLVTPSRVFSAFPRNDLRKFPHEHEPVASNKAGFS